MSHVWEIKSIISKTDINVEIKAKAKCSNCVLNDEWEQSEL